MTNTTKNNCLQNSICHRVAPSKDLTIKPPKLNKNAPRKTSKAPGNFEINFILFLKSNFLFPFDKA